MSEQPMEMSAEQVRELVIRMASLNPVEFDAAMVAVSESLSDEEFGRYSRLYKQNYQGGDLVEKLTNAYDAHPATAHAMQNAALKLLMDKKTTMLTQLDSLTQQIAGVVESIQQHVPQA